MRGICGWSHLHPLGPCSPALPASSCGHIDLCLPQLSVVPSHDLTALSAVPQLAASLIPLRGGPTISSFPLSHLPPSSSPASFHYPRIPGSPVLFPVSTSQHFLPDLGVSAPFSHLTPSRLSVARCCRSCARGCWNPL